MRDWLDRNGESLVTNLVAAVIWAIVVWGIQKLWTFPPLVVPIWLVAIVITIPAAAWWYLRTPTKLRPVIGRKFGREKVVLDGKHFINCEFDATEMIFHARAGVSFEHCTFSHPKFVANGPAGNAIAFLRAMKASPAMKIVFDHTFDPPA